MFSGWPIQFTGLLALCLALFGALNVVRQIASHCEMHHNQTNSFINGLFFFRVCAPVPPSARSLSLMTGAPSWRGVHLENRGAGYRRPLGKLFRSAISR